MRSSTREMIGKVKNLLIDNEYCTAGFLAEKCGLSKSSIYRIIRLMRLEGIGVLPGCEGYILSEFAHKRDDVRFLRKINGRRTSDVISLGAAENHIRRRWRAVKDRRDLNLITGPLTADLSMLKEGADVLLSSDRKLNT